MFFNFPNEIGIFFAEFEIYVYLPILLDFLTFQFDPFHK